MVPDTGVMDETIWILSEYASQFGLLGAMSREIADACRGSGLDARLFTLRDEPQPVSGVMVFMNVPRSIESLPRALFTPGSALRAVQIGVDHPFALPDGVLDSWRERNGLANLRLCMPCLDDAHLLRARFPGLVHAWVPHGIPRSALCALDDVSRSGWDAREFDVVVTGSVRPLEHIERGRAQLNPGVRAMLSEIVHLMIKEPHLGYLAAFDLVMGSRGVITGDWDAQKSLWNLAIAEVNRARRLSLVASLQGLKVGVFGSREWERECTGTIEYAGEVSYEDCAGAFERGRVALAWGPTQFVHAYSERIMQAMAGGACVVADDRILLRRDFNRPETTATLFDLKHDRGARHAIEAHLSDPDGSVEQARRGRKLVEHRCLWTHRLGALLDTAHARVSGAA